MERVCGCMSVCACVCMYVCMYVSLYVCICVGGVGVIVVILYLNQCSINT